MPAYNFDGKFAQAVSEGKKRQTIRAIGKRHHARPGEFLQLYTDQRTKACRKLVSPDPICASVHQVEIFMERAGMCWEIQIRVDGRRVDRESFAKADGFEELGHLEDFFQNIYGLPFEGILIKW